jgi:hypothetical protein
VNNVFYVDAYSGGFRNAGNPFGLRGRWLNTRIFENRTHYNDFKKWGADVIKPLWEAPYTKNGITDEGIHYNLDTAFTNNDTAETAWYAGLIDNSGYTGVDPSDTMASHTGWSEATTYDEAVRQTLGFAAASSRSITAEVSFTMNATKTINGLFIVTVSTKGGATGVLWSTALYSTAPDLTSGQVLTSNYTLSD